MQTNSKKQATKKVKAAKTSVTTPKLSSDIYYSKVRQVMLGKEDTLVMKD